jgi:hypothetical protein
MNGRWSLLIGSVLFAVGLTACSGNGGTSGNITPPSGSSLGANLQLKTQVILPNLGPGSTPAFSYDIGGVDPSLHHYYLADRTNKALDVIDTRTNVLRQIPGPYAGITPSNNNAGPDGVVFIPGNPVVYVGDVNSVKLVDTNAGTTLAKTISITNSGFRTDEGCYDKDDNLVMFANPADNPPFDTWINASTNAIVAKLPYPGSAGLEACVYDPATKTFFLNNDGTPANPNGELDTVTAASVLAGTPAIANAYSEGNCAPTGLDLGPNHQLVVGCDAPQGDPQLTLIMNTSGAIVKTINGVGGEDEVAYDPFTNRYYTASRDWTANGISQTGSATAVFVPVLGVIDASTNTWLANIPTGKGSHSVAADSSTGHVFVPVPSTATANGGVNVYGLVGSP